MHMSFPQPNGLLAQLTTLNATDFPAAGTWKEHPDESVAGDWIQLS